MASINAVFDNLISDIFCYVNKSDWKDNTLEDLTDEIKKGRICLKSVSSSPILALYRDVFFCEVYHQDKKLVEAFKIWSNGNHENSIDKPINGVISFEEDPVSEVCKQLSVQLNISHTLITHGETDNIKFYEIPERSVYHVNTQQAYIEEGKIQYPNMPLQFAFKWFIWEMPEPMVKNQYLYQGPDYVSVYQWVDKNTYIIPIQDTDYSVGIDYVTGDNTMDGTIPPSRSIKFI